MYVVTRLVAVLLLLCDRVVVTDVVDDLDRVREEEDVAPAQHKTYMSSGESNCQTKWTRPCLH